MIRPMVVVAFIIIYFHFKTAAEVRVIKEKHRARVAQMQEHHRLEMMKWREKNDR